MVVGWPVVDVDGGRLACSGCWLWLAGLYWLLMVEGCPVLIVVDGRLACTGDSRLACTTDDIILASTTYDKQAGLYYC